MRKNDALAAGRVCPLLLQVVSAAGNYRSGRWFAGLPIINCRNCCKFRISDKDAFSIIGKQERASCSDIFLSEQINIKIIHIKKDPAFAGSVSLYYLSMSWNWDLLSCLIIISAIAISATIRIVDIIGTPNTTKHPIAHTKPMNPASIMILF